MTLHIGETAPDFEAATTDGPIRFHDWIGDSWAILFSHPKDFTPVCTTELGYMAKIQPEFDKRNVKVIGLSVDPTSKHEQWAKDIEETQGAAPNYPIIGDADFNVSKLYGMLGADVSGDPADRTAADNQTVRNVFVVGPDKKVKLILVYPMTTGRNFDEVLRVIDSLQLTAKHKVATPVNWQRGDDVIIAGSVSNDDAKEIWPDGWREPKPYIRIVAGSERRQRHGELASQPHGFEAAGLKLDWPPSWAPGTGSAFSPASALPSGSSRRPSFLGGPSRRCSRPRSELHSVCSSFTGPRPWPAVSAAWPGRSARHPSSPARSSAEGREEGSPSSSLQAPLSSRGSPSFRAWATSRSSRFRRSASGSGRDYRSASPACGRWRATSPIGCLWAPTAGSTGSSGAAASSTSAS